MIYCRTSLIAYYDKIIRASIRLLIKCSKNKVTSEYLARKLSSGFDIQLDEVQ